MYLFQPTSLPLIFFLLFTCFDALNITCSTDFSDDSCFPDRYVVFRDCCCFDQCIVGSKVVHRQLTIPSWDFKIWKSISSFGCWNAISNAFIIVITLLNIAVYKLRQVNENNLGKKGELCSLSSELLCRRFSFAEIELATNGFDKTFLIGKGGFGKVYRGVIDNGKSTVAIKRLDSKSRQGASEFWTEISMLSKFRHCHLVSLVGYCDEYQEKILVYEYMPGGNLNDHLHKTRRSNKVSPLSWVQRLKICIGTAHALNYLHTGIDVQRRVIHRDIKSSNILLDENLAAKVSDFGVAKIAADQPCEYLVTEVKGSFGYFDPHYFVTRKLTRKSDVYAFGVILFESLCGRPAVDLTLEEEQQSLSRWAKHCVKRGMSGLIIDPSLKGQIAPDCLMMFTQTAEQCLEHFPRRRPTMSEVVAKLESAMAVQERHDPSSSVGRHDGVSRSGNIITVQSYMSSDRSMTLPRIIRQIFSVKDQFSSGNLKFSRKEKNNNNCIPDSVFPSKYRMPNRYGGVSEEVSWSWQIETLKLKVFTFAELKSLTMNFSKELVLSKGDLGIGYMGWVDKKTYAPSMIGDGLPVIVKRRDTNGFQGNNEWQMELKILGGIRHPHIAKFLGFCLEDRELLLVFEYTPNGSLEKFMFKSLTEPLPWATLLKIMLGAARGLAFMHKKENQVIYSDFKSECILFDTDNIMLDKDFNAKLADYCLTKVGGGPSKTHISRCDVGALDSGPAEYITSGLRSMKNDIYGFGVVLLKLLIGLSVNDYTWANGVQNLVEWARSFLPDRRQVMTVIDPRLLHDCPPEAAFQCASLILECVQSDPRKRPRIEQVLRKLEKINVIKMKQRECESCTGLLNSSKSCIPLISL